LKSTPRILPVGKLPPELLSHILTQAPIQDERVLLGPGVGLDCAVVEFGSRLLVFKSDPITFATGEIGWYAVQVNANDIATTGAIPSWFLMTLLLPEGGTTAQLVEEISEQVFKACEDIGVAVIGGHTEITHGLDRPILVGTLIGEVAKDKLITPRGAQAGDRLLLTKGIPIEATTILAREFPDRLSDQLSSMELVQARDFLYDPGISVMREARLAVGSGRVTAMHDPTEGGLSAALWELAEACGNSIVFNPGLVPVIPLAGRVCQMFEIDPLNAIASGALLLTAPAEGAGRICAVIEEEGITCAEIGWVESGSPMVWRSTGAGKQIQPRPERDAIAKLFDE
jgi:hydrogenase maturation factor